MRATGTDLRINVRTLVDGAIVGGMSYALDATLTRPARVRPPKKRGELHELGEELLRQVDLQGREVKSVEVTHITVDIALRQPSDDEDDDKDDNDDRY